MGSRLIDLLPRGLQDRDSTGNIDRHSRLRGRLLLGVPQACLALCALSLATSPLSPVALLSEEAGALSFAAALLLGTGLLLLATRRYGERLCTFCACGAAILQAAAAISTAFALASPAHAPIALLTALMCSGAAIPPCAAVLVRSVCPVSPWRRLPYQLRWFYSLRLALRAAEAFPLHLTDSLSGECCTERSNALRRLSLHAARQSPFQHRGQSATGEPRGRPHEQPFGETLLLRSVPRSCSLRLHGRSRCTRHKFQHQLSTLDSRRSGGRHSGCHVLRCKP